jgi:hypothetical protein
LKLKALLATDSKETCILFNKLLPTYTYNNINLLNDFIRIYDFRALDDIEITHRPCPIQDECDFEMDWCSFKNTTSGNYLSWTRKNNGTELQNTGPKFDHVGFIIWLFGYESFGFDFYFIIFSL